MGSFKQFIVDAWPHTGEANEFVDNWHIDVIANALEDVLWGGTNRLLITMPPGMMKSLIMNVFFPMWARTQKQKVFIRNTVESMVVMDRFEAAKNRLLSSEWYRGKYQVIAHHWIEETDVESKKPRTLLLIDSLHKSIDVLSNKRMEESVRFLLRDVRDLLTYPLSVVIAGSRLSVNDIFGVLLHENPDVSEDLSKDLKGSPLDSVWKHICLPMRFEPDHVYKCPEDYRTFPGELLWPEAFTQERISSTMRMMELDKDNANVEAQFNQDPVRLSGSLMGLRSRHPKTIVPKFKIGETVWMADDPYGIPDLLSCLISCIHVKESEGITYTTNIPSFRRVLEKHVFHSQSDAWRFIDAENKKWDDRQREIAAQNTPKPVVIPAKDDAESSAESQATSVVNDATCTWGMEVTDRRSKMMDKRLEQVYGNVKSVEEKPNAEKPVDLPDEAKPSRDHMPGQSRWPAAMLGSARVDVREELRNLILGRMMLSYQDGKISSQQQMQQTVEHCCHAMDEENERGRKVILESLARNLIFSQELVNVVGFYCTPDIASRVFNYATFTLLRTLLRDTEMKCGPNAMNEAIIKKYLKEFHAVENQQKV